MAPFVNALTNGERQPRAAPSTTNTGTYAIENGVEPPYSIRGALPEAAMDHQDLNLRGRERRKAAVLHIKLSQPQPTSRTRLRYDIYPSVP